MAKESHPSFPSVLKQMRAFGERLQMARLRRELTTVQFSERVGVSRETIRRLEQGDPTIAIGTYMRALRVLGLDQDINTLASDDVLGKKLQDVAMLKVQRTRVVVKDKRG
ncbi:helix-turn-helix protein [Sphaerotilus hippei]|uniref:Helix-turn-helix protein n=1 Tax=Sphaerotilus hippei TaxID=744406 RepID=A0A318H2F0_9BURK|nr:helix-turn-helix transcriptional regulator [Sphaerotilus hippei]PXW94949.1 helix-turn-helix protein [Sphaerotilus hippei]